MPLVQVSGKRHWRKGSWPSVTSTTFVVACWGLWWSVSVDTFSRKLSTCTRERHKKTKVKQEFYHFGSMTSFTIERPAFWCAKWQRRDNATCISWQFAGGSVPHYIIHKELSLDRSMAPSLSFNFCPFFNLLSHLIDLFNVSLYISDCLSITVDISSFYLDIGLAFLQKSPSPLLG